MHEKHMALIDAVNNAKTQHEHWSAYCTLNGWRQGLRDCGLEPGLIEADLEQFSRGHEHRSMCCGVFTEWIESPNPKLSHGQEPKQ
jgi:hypothetical protein